MPINELVVRYLQFAVTYYVHDGQPTGEVDNLKDAVGPLCLLYGSTAASAFGPKSLKLVREHLIQAGSISRGVINSRIDRIKRIFKWAVSEELVPPSVYEGLRAVAGLRYGRSDAREAEPVKPIADEWIEATLKHLPPMVADMVRLQRATGMRSGNLVTMRPCDLDRSGKVWLYSPETHKTRYLGKRLQIAIGPQGQAILNKYLPQRSPTDFLFPPAEADAWRLEQRQLKRKPRKTKLYPSERRRVETEKQNGKRRLRRRPRGDHYTTDSYRRTISYAINTAIKAGNNIPSWFPHQLRHTRGTEIRRLYGIEGAQLALGHSKANITEVYAERDLERAKRIARKTG
jgi:hypothetical protein